MVDIIDQKKFDELKLFDIKGFTANVTKVIPKNTRNSVTILFASDSEIKKLNNKFRDKNSTTDVLSFPYEVDEFDIDTDQLGEIIISVEQANRQAIENNLPLELEIKQLVLHGILHLSGYDHETDNGEMNELELKLREKLGIN